MKGRRVAKDPKEAQALWYVGPEKAEIRAVAAAAPDQIPVRTLYSGLSRGTERLVFSGRVPDSEFQRMRAPHMEGQFPFPVKYGYAAVGRAESGALAGRTVFALHPHQSVFALSADALVPMPDAVPPE